MNLMDFKERFRDMMNFATTNSVCTALIVEKKNSTVTLCVRHYIPNGNASNGKIIGVFEFST
jgi:hypothetical protein